MKPCFAVAAAAVHKFLGVTIIAALSLTAAKAQTFTVIHTFTAQGDGANPAAGLTMLTPGALYGTTEYTQGNGNGGGTVFKLSNKASGWVLSPLFEFDTDSEGVFPTAAVTINPNGTLYGTTAGGGGLSNCGDYCGTVFALRPHPSVPREVLNPWNETILHKFNGGPGGTTDGAAPGYGALVTDGAGNLYGTTRIGGTGCSDLNGCGTVYAVNPFTEQETVLYRFTGAGDGFEPLYGVTFDATGNLYGTTFGGGDTSCTNGCGTIFELSPTGSGWTKRTIYSFQSANNGPYYPSSGLIADHGGNLYGVTVGGGGAGYGTVFELSPSGETWQITVLFGGFSSTDAPQGNLAIDPAGNLYGTYAGNYVTNHGGVFKLKPSDNGWTYTTLHVFTQNDGGTPVGGLVVDPQGDIFGTTWEGGDNQRCFSPPGCGVVFEITP